MDAIRALIKQNRPDAALRAIHQAVRRTVDFSEYTVLCRLRRRLEADLPKSLKVQDLKIAMLGGATTGFFEEPIKLELETLGIQSRLHCGGYDTYVAEMLDPNSEVAVFGPDVALLILTPFNISEWPEVGDNAKKVDELAEKITGHWLHLCASLHANTGCEIILNNMHRLPLRSIGNAGAKMPWDRNSFLREINRRLAADAPPYVHISDIDTLSSIHGVSRWFDYRFWYHSKQPVSFDFTVPFVRNLAAIIGGIYGRNCKCVVLDLDNTLWGGVVGDQGVGGIKIGEGDAEGESFKGFQEYLLELKKRGLLLAVCSKNEEANALEPFQKLPEMVLKRNDFVSFKANWDPKPENLRAIARELNIGLDALLFVDDNPAEREHVRQVLPEVRVVELPEDPALYAMELDRCGWLETVRFSTEDFQKTEQYQKNTEREQLKSGCSDYDAYLRSLNQRAEIRPFGPDQLERITQLINKTNQFNLTTRRVIRSEVEAMMTDRDTLAVYAKLLDRFGDNGLISVVAGHKQDKMLILDLWLMSCRVFKRGVEHLLANYLFERALELDIEKVQGLYIPTAKNKIVEDFYAKLGFKKINENEGATTWEIKTADYKNTNVQIALV